MDAHDAQPEGEQAPEETPRASLADLFATFARIGLFTFGGGYAMLPMLQTEVVERRRWVSEGELLNYYAVGQCTPGIISVNTATFVGYRLRGVVGGVVATLGVVFPSVVIITLIALFLERVVDRPIVQHAFAGVRVAVAALMLQAIVKLWKTGVRDAFGLFVFALGFAIAAFTRLSPVIVILCAIALGLSFAFFGLGQFVGVKWGTILCALINGWIIGRFSAFYEKHWRFEDKMSWRPFFTGEKSLSPEAR